MVELNRIYYCQKKYEALYIRYCTHTTLVPVSHVISSWPLSPIHPLSLFKIVVFSCMCLRVFVLVSSYLCLPSCAAHAPTRVEVCLKHGLHASTRSQPRHQMTTPNPGNCKYALHPATTLLIELQTCCSHFHLHSRTVHISDPTTMYILSSG